MSSAVRDSRPLPPTCTRRIFRVASEPLPDQVAYAGTSHNVASDGSHTQDPFVEQLGRLASQHHASEYNRLKFGPNGSPVVYVPYSMQMPDHYREMQAHQLRCAEQRAWWPSDGVGLSPGPDPLSIYGDTQSLGKSTEANLREKLSAAMSSRVLDSQRLQTGLRTDTPVLQPHWQTSETHPIVISTIIPSEILPIISAHLERCEYEYPVVFRLPRSYLLDRMLSRSIESVVPEASQIPIPPPVIPPLLPSASSRSSPQSMAKSLKLPSVVWVHPSVRRAFLGNTGSFRDLSGKRPRPASFEATSATPYSRLRQDGHDRPRVLRIASSPAVPQLGPSIPSSGLQDLSAANRGNPSQLHAITTAAAPAITMPDGSSAPPLGTARLIGNLYMSSCPGKKVRLGGPVRGRSTVCRDLRSDLARIRDVGVVCIVCCLDDGELQSLGVTWPEYRQVAGEFGIDILRIPIPEGLPPNDPAALDSHLSKLIDAYTLRGSAVLVHCRGGVGRAGIIAACWALKLGLCGWLDIQDPPFQHAELDEANSVSDRTVAPNFNTMRLVERLIAVVRRRRSPKAIETYEQVKFLVDFVEYLREQAEPTRRNATIDWFADWDVRVE